MALLSELQAAVFLGYTSSEQWRRAKKDNQTPKPDVTRGERPVHEYWLEESLLRFIKNDGTGRLSRDELRRRIGGDQAA